MHIKQTHVVPKSGFKGLVENWRSDFLAAISVSLVALPLGLGVAVASGAPPISGLTSAIIGGVVVTLFRGSHLAINGPAAGLIAVLLAGLVTLDDGSDQVFAYLLAATCVAGVLQGVSSGYAQKVVTSKKVANFNVDYCPQPHKMPFGYL